MPTEKIKVRYKDVRMEVEIDQGRTWEEYEGLYGKRNCLAMLAAGVTKAYREYVYKRLGEGIKPKQIAEELEDWNPPGELPKTEIELLAEKMAALSPDEQRLVVEETRRLKEVGQ